LRFGVGGGGGGGAEDFVLELAEPVDDVEEDGGLVGELDGV